jgi:DNA modification methylase
MPECCTGGIVKPYYQDGPVTIYEGDCIEIMRQLPDESVHAVVTDPPYGLEFMGREWDGADGFRRSLNAADAGRDSVFGRTSKTSPEYRTRPVVLGQISEGDRSKGPLPTGPGSNSRGYADHDAHTFQAWCEAWAREALRVLKPGGHMLAFGGTRTWHRLAVAVEDAGFEIRDSIAWLYGSGFPKGGEAVTKKPGWGTALKPAFEPVVVGRRPLRGTVAANLEEYGTGGMNIDANRIHTVGSEGKAYTVKRLKPGATLEREGGNWRPDDPDAERFEGETKDGRWPANVILDEDSAADLDEQSGVTSSGMMRPGTRVQSHGGQIYGKHNGLVKSGATYGDSGGASRFFYTAKADSSERPEVDGVQHPTVKPLDLMQWLVRLVTPEGGTVLEPFAGSGTTVEACLREGFDCIAIEREPTYLPLILQRVRKPHEQALFA